MSNQPSFDPQDLFGVKGNLKEDELRTPDRSSRPGSSFSPVPLFSPLSLKYEGGADEVPCITETNADNPNLLDSMWRDNNGVKYIQRHDQRISLDKYKNRRHVS